MPTPRACAALLPLLWMTVLCAPSEALAHQPAYVANQQAITITDPEISKAYYGTLSGAPARYTITADAPFELYINLLTPDTDAAPSDVSAVVTDGTGQFITSLVGPAAQWTPWRETYAGDDYRKGPEFRSFVPAGTYMILVTNGRNEGPYVLAVGEAEDFSDRGPIELMVEIFRIKTEFFGKPWYAIFEGVLGMILLALLAAATVSAGVIITIVRRKKAARLRT